MLPKSSPNPELSMSVQLFERLKNAPYGTFMSYDELSSIVSDPQGEGRSHILRARKWLLKIGKLLLCKTGEGYYIGMPEEHVPWAKSENESAKRKASKALEAVVYVDFSQLTEPQKQLAIEEQLRIGLPYALANRIARQKTLSIKTEIKMPTAEEFLEALRAKKQIE